MHNSPEKKAYSHSVSLIACFFIVFGGFITAIWLALNLLLQMVHEDGVPATIRQVQSVIDMPAAVVSEIDNYAWYKDQIQQSYTRVQSAIEIPSVIEFAIDNFAALFPLFFCTSFLIFISAIGLLLRINAARILFIALLSLGILWNIASGVFTYVLYDAIVIPLADGRQLQFVIIGPLAVVAMLFAINILLSAGLTFKLISPSVRAEFVKHASNQAPALATDTSQPDQQRDRVSVPSGLHIDKQDGELIISRRWFSFSSIVSAIILIVGIGILIIAHTLGSSVSGGSILGEVSLTFWLMGVGLVYHTLTEFINTTRFHIGDDSLSVRHGPLPWKKNRTVSARDIQQLYCTKHRIYSGSLYTASYRLNAVLEGTDSVSLLFSWRRPDQLLFIEQAIEEHLGIEDYRVGVKEEMRNP